MVHHALIPLFMGGSPDMIEFPSYCDGHTYATAELTDPHDRDCPAGACEFVVCTRTSVDWFGAWLTGFTHKSVEHVFEDGDVWDFTDDPDGSPFGPEAFITLELTSQQKPLRYMGKNYRLMLIMNLTRDELDYIDTNGKSEFIELLRRSKAYPYADPNRESILAS